MIKRNSIEMSKYIEERYKEYLKSSFKFDTKKLQNLFEEQLEKEDLFKGPYVDLNLPFKRGKNINQLIEEGIVSNEFKKLGDIDFERPLYAHQEEAINNIKNGNGAIITTGTGSGKTESFLYPILNDILYDIENGNNDTGIRAIFLYPMNALVNDQLERVREILSVYPNITYGFFTGDTPETISKNDIENNDFIPENELVSRKEIRENPPHLLFTNYSMLEFLLIRPNDYVLFKNEMLKNWKFVVLDEAHTYYGSKGIEISFLMRRLTGLADKKPRFILTSATLGEQGKSENEIINFAERLTSTKFKVDDIIFSKKINLNKEMIQYTINSEDYSILKQAKQNDNIDLIKAVACKYKNIESDDLSRCLYELLISDSNVHKLYNILKDKSLPFKEILNRFKASISETQLIDLIDLINYADKDGIEIFSLKYHSFVRPLSGGYITLEDNPKLSLTKTNNIENLKAFEVGNCRYCNTLYIIGKIKHNLNDDLDYLLQNAEVDIYENYGENEFVEVDFFLQKNTIDEGHVDIETVEEYKVCSGCGAIFSADNLNAKQCSCDNKHLVSLYKVINASTTNNPEMINNIRKCPCCLHSGRSGIVKSLNIGKDEGTALIAQTLYEAIDQGSLEVIKPKKFSLKPRLSNNMNEAQNNIQQKQFLSFSDSRQQASFFAKFFEANHTRLLRKRLIWKVIEDNNYRDIKLSEMISILTNMIKEQNLFPDKLEDEKLQLDSEQNAWVTVLRDLLKVDGSYDGEGLGLYHFDIDLSGIFEGLKKENIQEEDIQDALGVNKKELETIMQVVFSLFKTTPAIRYLNAKLSSDQKKEYLEYRRFDNYIMLQKEPVSNMKQVKSFLPVQSSSNSVVRYIQKVCNCNQEKAKEILEIIFNFGVVSEIFTKHATKEMYQISADNYIVKNYKTTKYYQCQKCGRITLYNVRNICVQDKCDGELVEVDPDIALEANYYRKQYKTKKVESIVVKEHTAQLSKKEAKKYQEEFKKKNINILSCSTTFEMGVDIGNLETVFMRNIPPTPANYVQRAGRAGRRKENTAYILTYCNSTSHDYTYFCEPEKMISGIIQPPYFNVVNNKIILRHLMATCLGFFFREHPDSFKNIDNFVFNDGINMFKKYVSSHPTKLNDYINNKVLSESIYNKYHNFKWFDNINGEYEKLEYFNNSIQSIVGEYEKAIELAKQENRYAEVENYNGQIKKIKKSNVINNLSGHCVIPKYGFPVDVVDLQVYENGYIKDAVDMNRDLKIAITEYAPDSEVIVDKIKYTSKYITLPKTSELTKYYFQDCPKCGKINISISTRTQTECKYCGAPLPLAKEFYIEPIHGFKTGVTKESATMKPKRSYSGEVTYIGEGIKDDNNLNIEDIIFVSTSSNDKLLIMNKSNFYMCPLCGYSEIIKNPVSLLPKTTKRHNNFHQYECKYDTLEKIKIGHTFQTDVARFTIPLLTSNHSKALSFLYAFLEGISRTLEIERRDIDGLLERNSDQGTYDVLIYDNVPGGAGHVKRLVKNKQIIKDILQNALIKVSQECCDENTSCYNCLRNYYNQAYHNKLKRKYAKEVIQLLLEKIKE